MFCTLAPACQDSDYVNLSYQTFKVVKLSSKLMSNVREISMFSFKCFYILCKTINQHFRPTILPWSCFCNIHIYSGHFMLPAVTRYHFNILSFLNQNALNHSFFASSPNFCCCGKSFQHANCV